MWFAPQSKPVEPALTESEVSSRLVNPSPFDLPGRGRAAALCLHGLTGTPYEVRSLGEAIAAAGIRAVGPALPGHNETPERLAATSYTDWLEAARTEFHRLREDFESVFIVGMSMGGLLALALAEEEPVDAIATIGTPLVLHHPFAWLIPLVKYLRPMSPKSRGSDIRDPVARARHVGYGVMPLNSVHELQRLQRRVRPQLARITAPDPGRARRTRPDREPAGRGRDSRLGVVGGPRISAARGIGSYRSRRFRWAGARPGDRRISRAVHLSPESEPRRPIIACLSPQGNNGVSCQFVSRNVL